MTTTKTTGFRLPDPPEREPDEMTSIKHLAMTGSACTTWHATSAGPKPHW